VHHELRRDRLTRGDIRGSTLKEGDSLELSVGSLREQRLEARVALDEAVRCKS